MAEARTPEPGSNLRVIGISVAATSVVALPSMLVGAMAVLMQRDLSFGEAELGIAVATSFGTGALVAIPVGRFADRAGPRTTIRLGLLFAAAALLGIGLATGGWLPLIGWMAFAGAGITTIQLGTNVLITRAVPSGRRGLAFGIKQAAVPLSSMAAGLALPLIGIAVGWQVAFLGAALAIPVIAFLVPDGAAGRLREPGDRRGEMPVGSLVLLATGVAFASAGGNATPAFLVPSIVDRGLSPGMAGLVLAAGSLVGVGARVGAGWMGDRIGSRSLAIVAVMIGVGAIGYLGLAVATEPVLIVGSAALAFGGGWGWGGLMLLAVSRLAPSEPGRAMGVVQIGPMAGAVAGPLVFGFVAEELGFGLAWSIASAFAITGVLIILFTRRFVRSGD